jgi:hypothetical protein
LKWYEKRERWSREYYEGKKKKIKMIVDRSDKGWYFYGGGYNSLADGKAYETLEQAQMEAEKWIDNNYKTARID